MRLAVFLFFLAQFYPVAADERTWQVTTTSDELAPLTDDLSRADLFKLVIAAAEKEAPPRAARRSLYQRTPFKFPQDAAEEQGKPRTNSIFGIDISHHNGRNFSFDSLKDENVPEAARVSKDSSRLTGDAKETTNTGSLAVPKFFQNYGYR